MNASASTERKQAAWGNVALCALLAALAGTLLMWHMRDEEWRLPEASRWLAATAVLLVWVGFTAWLGWRRRAIQQATSSLSKSVAGGDAVLVLFASQTGTAEQVARQTTQSLQQAGMQAQLIGLGDVGADMLATATRVLFVVSTTGEGDAPDSAARFITQCMRAPLDLSHLRYGLLALGDRDYDDFCGFGRQLLQWLQHSRATALFDAVEVDNGDPAALRHWQHHLALLSGATELPDWQRPDYQHWQLIERSLLNPGSQGGACFHIALRPLEGALAWQAGDLVEIGPRHAATDVERWLAQPPFDGSTWVTHEGRQASLREWLMESHLPAHGDVRGCTPAQVVAALQALPHREYSIASLPSDGALHLLVRRMQRCDGTSGIGSGWLTQHAELGGDIALRIRPNRAFHAPSDDRPLILIGNGTGLAGLRALLKSRIEAGHLRNWLLFGERQLAHDFYHGDEIMRWREEGKLARLDLVWSREGGSRLYVQDRLREAAVELRHWVAEGAAIYVCGSLAGMAPGVDHALRDMLGDEAVEQLRGQGRYRRDVY